VIITVSPEDASRILKLNGFTFAGSPLMIEERNEPQSQSAREKEALSNSAKETQDKIRGVLSTRYDTSLKLLNLSALGQDSGLVQMGMFDEKKRITKLFPVLMVVCDRIFTTAEQKREAVVSITLANNELDTIAQVTSLAQTFPDIQNLDLSGNKFTDLRALEGWRWRFRRLQNLKISGNPIETLTPNYQQELVKWFPALQILNDVQVRTPEEIAAITETAKKAATGVSPIPISGPDFRDVNQIGENFARQFFTLYDSDRAGLASTFYDTDSVHSISVNVSAPRADTQVTPAPSWSAYIKHSRNFMKITHLGPRMSRAYKGVDAIKTFWSELPLTHHPDLSTQPSKYLIDCHPVPGLSDPTGQNAHGVDGLILMVHGEFEEKDGSGQVSTRSFSRTFVLGPGQPGGPAIRVVSDIAVLRAWSPLASTSSTASTPAPAPAPAPTPATGAPSSEEQAKQEMVLQLANHTHMTHEYAVMCLEGSAWDLQKAFEAFTANKVREGMNG
jgi:nuclear RNA export factor